MSEYDALIAGGFVYASDDWALQDDEGRTLKSHKAQVLKCVAIEIHKSNGGAQPDQTTLGIIKMVPQLFLL